MTNKQKSTWKWDQRSQKLTRTTIAKSIDEKTKRQIHTEITDVFNKEAAIKLKSDLFLQNKNMKKFMDEMAECKELNTKKESLPMYKEIIDILKALKWETDRQARTQYEQALPQYEKVKKDYEDLDKVMPTFEPMPKTKEAK